MCVVCVCVCVCCVCVVCVCVCVCACACMCNIEQSADNWLEVIALLMDCEDFNSFSFIHFFGRQP